MPPKRKPEQLEEDEAKEELQPRTPKEEPYEQGRPLDDARKAMDEKREERRRLQFIQQFVAPLRESEKYSGSQNARSFAAKWDSRMSGAAMPMKFRTEVFMMLLREFEALEMRELIADEVIDMTDWPTVKQRFEATFEPTTNNIVRDATTLLNMRQRYLICDNAT